MEIITEYALDFLCEKTVTVLINKYIILDGVKQKVGDTEACCYNNMQHDREILEKKLPANFYHAVIDIWGPEPILEDINGTAE